MKFFLKIIYKNGVFYLSNVLSDVDVIEVAVFVWRILSDTDEHREIVLSGGAIKPIATMLSSEDTSVVQAAMKTTMHFVNKSVLLATKFICCNVNLVSMKDLFAVWLIRTDDRDDSLKPAVDVWT